MNLTIKLDMRDGFIYVTEQVGRQRKRLFRGTSIEHVLKTLTIKYAKGVPNAENSEDGNGSSNCGKALDTIQQ